MSPTLLHYRFSWYFKTKQKPNIKKCLVQLNTLIRTCSSGSEWRRREESSTLEKLGGWGTWSGRLLPVTETQETSLNTAWHEITSSASCCGCFSVFIIVPFFPEGTLLLLIFQGDSCTGILSLMCPFPESLT